MGARAVAVAAVALAGAVGAVLVLHERNAPAAAAPAPQAVIELPASPAPALDVREPAPLRASRHLSFVSPVRRPVAARAAPSATAAIVDRLATRTPESTANVVLVLGRRTDAAGRVWLRVRLPGAVGWVPRAALGGYTVVRTHLIVDTSRLTATLFRDGRRVFRAPVGIGRDRWPTPRGRFYVRNRLDGFSNPFYGPLAFGTSARSAVLTDWPGGGFVGIHGTNAPDLLPGRVSHGCIRLRNDDILRLGRLLPVGTPVTVR